MERIIVNADDYGLNCSCSHAIVEAFELGLISSTTACANGEFITEAYQLAFKNQFSDKVGIHVNLTEGVPLTDWIKQDPFFCTDGRFHNRINRYRRLNHKQILEVQCEVNAQIERLRELGFQLSHADSHHHIHTSPYLGKEIQRILKKRGIKKIRIHRNVGNISFLKRILKRLYNLMLSKQGFVTGNIFGSWEDFRENPGLLEMGICEIMVHPDYDENGVLIDRIKVIDNKNIGYVLMELSNILDTYTLVSYKEV